MKQSTIRYGIIAILAALVIASGSYFAFFSKAHNEPVTSKFLLEFVKTTPIEGGNDLEMIMREYARKVIADFKEAGLKQKNIDVMTSAMLTHTEIKQGYIQPGYITVQRFRSDQGERFALIFPSNNLYIGFFDSKLNFLYHIKVPGHNNGYEQFSAFGNFIQPIDVNADYTDDLALIPLGTNCCGDNGTYISLNEKYKELPKMGYITHASAGIVAHDEIENQFYITRYIDNNAKTCDYTMREFDAQTFTLKPVDQKTNDRYRKAFCLNVVGDESIFANDGDEIKKLLASDERLSENMRLGKYDYLPIRLYYDFPRDGDYSGMLNFPSEGSLLITKSSTTKKLSIAEKVAGNEKVPFLFTAQYDNTPLRQTQKWYEVSGSDSYFAGIHYTELVFERETADGIGKNTSCKRNIFGWDITQQAFIEQDKNMECLQFFTPRN